MPQVMMGTAAFIDHDGTLCEQYLWQALFANQKQYNFKLLTLSAFIAFHTTIWLLYESHILSQDYFYRLHGTNLAWFLGGVSIDRAEEIWGWVIENQIIPICVLRWHVQLKITKTQRTVSS